MNKRNLRSNLTILKTSLFVDKKVWTLLSDMLRERRYIRSEIRNEVEISAEAAEALQALRVVGEF